MTTDIRIYQGDTIGFNYEKPYKIIVNSQIDLTGFTAEVTVDKITQIYPIDNGYFYLLMTSEETAQIEKGLHDLVIKVLDTENRVRTLDTSLRMVVN